MRLSSIRIEGIRNLGSLELRLASGSPLVVTGTAASGKTTVLEAILAAKKAFHPAALEPKTEGWLTAGRRSGMVELEWMLDDQDRELARVETPTAITRWGLGQPSSTAGLRLRELVERVPLAYFDVGRTLDGQSLRIPASPSLQAPRGPSKFSWIESRLVGLADDEANRTVRNVRAHGVIVASRDLGALRRFEGLLQTLSPQLRWAGTERVETRPRAMFARANGESSPIESFSDSERMAVLFAGAIDGLDLGNGLILIDAPELWQHPGDHARFFDAVAAAVPTAQLLSATTSAGILRALPREQVVVLGESGGPPAVVRSVGVR